MLNWRCYIVLNFLSREAFKFISYYSLSPLQVKQRCSWIFCILYESIAVRHCELTQPFDLYWSTAHPQVCNIECSQAEYQYEGDAAISLSLSLRTAAVISAAACTCRMWLESLKFVLSVLCGLFNPTQSSTGDWLANQVKYSVSDQYLSSSLLPELPIHVTAVLIPLAGTNARTCHAVWDPLTEVIHY